MFGETKCTLNNKMFDGIKYKLNDKILSKIIYSIK